MIEKIFRGIISLIGMILGFLLGQEILKQEWFSQLIGCEVTQQITITVYIVMILFFGILFFILFPLCHKGFRNLSAYLEKNLENVRLADLVIASGGLLLGLLIALLISFVISLISIPWLSSLLSALVYIALGYLGLTIALHKRDDILALFSKGKEKEKEVTAVKKTPRKKNTALSKLLDTSAIIDGRIVDVIRSGFLEGQVVVPTFVLAELQLLADSSDEMKHTRGRRGLAILQHMREQDEDPISILDINYNDLIGVDEKLLRLAKAKKMAIVTNDFNLNQVASLQGISVLNVNTLAEALKPVVLPGEKMKVRPVKYGRETGQAVAYLDDGTMIVIENGRKHIGKMISVTVTSILQTAAGRMIFARPEWEH